MNELQMGLLALGGVAVLGVFGYNKWQERRHRQVVERVFQQPGEDVLLGKKPEAPKPEAPARESGPVWREPGLAEAGRAVPEEAAPAQRLAPQAGPPEPFLEPVLPGDAPAESGLPADREAATVAAEERENLDLPLPASLLSARVDAIAVLELVEHVPAPQVLASQREALSRLKKPLHWVGFNDSQGAWEMIGPETPTAYRRLRVGLQLADRQGPVSGGDFALFSAAMQHLADELMAVVNMPSGQQALDQAQQLDRFCAGVDMQIGINLISRGTPFAGTKIRALAESAGMALTPDGSYVRCDDEGRPLFSLQNFETTGFAAETLKHLSTHGLVFLLDVPRVPKGLHVYSQMVELAKRFAEALNGVLVDDNRQPLAEPQLLHIRQEYVVKPQVAMEAQGIPAGGALALRLFN
ncbi:MAG: cell division protein ZipA C-terminal FtsZ-binding domain-containing protein [Azovibrio sp.]|uniref:cell division protein ZipA C-terminal FtsZ-binding domain-containing protein n=1 Tax=Azovibrio sp. TaxID=1872673 RepID=UPI003C70BB24